MISVNSILLNERQTYYDVLRDTQGLDFAESVDVTKFVNFHTNVLLESAIQLEEKAVQFNMQKDEWIAATDGFLKPRQVVGLMYMASVGPLATSTYAKLNRCSQPTALSDYRTW